MKFNIEKDKTKIAVIFGGISVEHDISIITGVQTINALDKTKFQVFPIYITKTGEWYYSQEFFDISIFKNISNSNNFSTKNCSRVNLSTDGFLCEVKNKKQIKKVKLDFCFLCTHGGVGENGALQGLLEMCNIPYSSPNVLSSSICMNKLTTKLILSTLNFPQTKYKAILDTDTTNLEETTKDLTFPLIVKPNSLGSSIGISFCKNIEELKTAVVLAHTFDKCLLIEEAVENLREVNIAVMGNSFELELSDIEEVAIEKDFLTFENKYINNDNSQKFNESKHILSVEVLQENSGQNNPSTEINLQDNSLTKTTKNSRTIPAKLEKNLEEQIIFLSTKAYKTLNCKGIVRIDFLISEQNKIYINELNTIPGSLSNYLWKTKNYNFTTLLNKIYDYAIKEKEEASKKLTIFNSTVLNKFDNLGKIQQFTK